MMTRGIHFFRVSLQLDQVLPQNVVSEMQNATNAGHSSNETMGTKR